MANLVEQGMHALLSFVIRWLRRVLRTSPRSPSLAPPHPAPANAIARIRGTPVLGPKLCQRAGVIFAFQRRHLIGSRLKSSIGNLRAQTLSPSRIDVVAGRHRSIETASACPRRHGNCSSPSSLPTFECTLHRCDKIPATTGLASIPAVILTT